jgi:signal peptidase I
MGLFCSGLLHAFSVQAGSMTPAMARGDQFVMEGLTFLARKPRRGDIVVMKTDGIAVLPPGGVYIKRVVGEPGDRLRLSQGTLYVNESPVTLQNEAGAIRYLSVRGERFLTSIGDLVTVPENHYFLVGDNSADSADSRIWGSVPAKNIMGRVAFRYWPVARAGRVK